MKGTTFQCAALAVAAFVVGATSVALRTRRPPSGEPRAAPAPQRAASRACPLADPSIVVRKAQRRLELFSATTLVRACPIALGSRPAGHKQREGDRRTPEGNYIVCVKNPASRFTLSLGLSYPSAHDAALGLAAGAISQEQGEQIARAAREGKQPPWDTPLGGEIFIHGGGAGGRDWTLGCIAVDDEDIRLLYRAVPIGTPVTILP